MAIDYDGLRNLLNDFKTLQKNREKFIREFLTEMGMRALAQPKKLTLWTPVI